MKRFGGWWLLGFILLALPLPAGVLEEIDRAVESLGAFVLRSIPDNSAQTILIKPLLSDRGGRNLLGDRLQSELELYLAGRLKNTRIVSQAETAESYTLSGEIQLYSGKIRIILKIIKPDRSLGAGTRFDLRRTPELESLLDRADDPAFSSFRQQRDPFEPDEQVGNEVVVRGSGTTSYTRYLGAGDSDRFRFLMIRAGPMVVEASSPLDLQLLLYREGEDIPILVNTQEADTGQARLEGELSPGYYVVEVMAFVFSREGVYTLVFNLLDQKNDEFEPDNHPQQALPITPGSQQQRIMEPGDVDWVELSYELPGFYKLYTAGNQVDTVLALFLDEDREILRDEGSGTMAYLGFFLGNRRIYGRISARGDLNRGGYSLIFEQFDPPAIYPDGTVHQLPAQQPPHYLRLRILQSGNYRIHTAGVSPGEIPADMGFAIYRLPNMVPARMPAEALYFLSSGDYLISIRAAQAEGVRLCIAAENAPGQCPISP